MAFVIKLILITFAILVYGQLKVLKHSYTKHYSDNKFYFQEHFYLFKYENEIRNKILEYKFQDKSYLYKTFAKLFIEDKEFVNFIKEYNIITCVPLSKKRFKTRGYNQSHLIVNEIAKNFNITYCKNLLIKPKNTTAQSTLSKEERLVNAKNAFSLNTKQAKKMPLEFISNDIKIAIFDDIFTTGATANECARVLSLLNPSKIGIITIAKD